MNKTTFKSGHIPWNKDKKGIHLSVKTEFRKGQKGINWKPVGTITSRIDKNKKIRKWIKITEPNIWELLYIYNWKKENKEIKKGYLIHHINFDHQDDDIKNLIMITRSEHINLHRNYRYRR